jgi:hypothetical protein
MWQADVLTTLAQNPSVLYLALGTNDAGLWPGADGWTVEDEYKWAEALSARSSSTCLVVVLPYTGEAAEANYPGVTAEEAEARAYITAEAQRTGAHVVDWADWAVQPGVTGADGIHINGNTGAEARMAMMNAGQAAC